MKNIKNTKLKRIGVLGGAGPESTILLYRMVISRFQAMGAHNHDDFPFMIILNVPIPDDVDMLHQEDLMKSKIIEASRILKEQADFIAVPCNTLHIFYNDIKKYSGLPVINMIEEVKRIIQKNGFKKLLLFGTVPLVKSKLYESNKYQIILPNDKEQEEVNNTIRHLLTHNIIKEDGQRLANIASRYDVDGVIFGCTELSLLHIKNKPVISSTSVLADAVVRECLKGE